MYVGRGKPQNPTLPTTLFLEPEPLIGLAKNVLTASGTGLTGDAIAQYMGNSNASFDSRRNLSFAVFSALYTGLFQHYYFEQLSRMVASPLFRLCINQLPTMAARDG